ncbi:helix-turn-helix transcriptional regulator [Desulfoferula mesophila]|uniref:Helix-turn-helix domain-containing protein n=1 Tax=Desulfoferula mesophila TaxID=3058419 RepID=A0AAU9EZD2_9BACT|nr:hypothetical protein FAK_12580 [Desulfoferula mesophilus]
MQDSLLTTKQAAAYLSLSHRTLEGLRLRGNGPRHAKLGGSVRYRIADLEAWIVERLRTSTSDTGQAGRRA